MSLDSLKRRITWRLQRISEELPSLPPLLTPSKIASWWRERRDSGLALPFLPRLPSRIDIAAWWRERRNEGFLPRLPQAPSPKEIGQWLREGPNLPQLPSPRSTAEWFRERPSAPKVLLWILAVVLVLGAVGYSALPARRAIKGWQARRLARQALMLVDQKQWTEANKKIHDAFLIRSTEVEVWRANAKLLSRAGRGSTAVEWWEKIGQLTTLSIEDRRDYAAAALSANELELAATQIHAIAEASAASLPSDRLLSGQLEAVRGHNSDALQIAQDVLRDGRSQPSDLLAASLLTLSVANRAAHEYSEAAARVFAVAQDVADPASLDALTVLGRQLAAIPMTEIFDRPLAIPVPEIPAGNISAVDIAERLERHPGTRPFHKMLALELRARAEPDRNDELIARAMKTYGDADDETLGALGAWLYTRGKFESILQLLPLDRAALNRQLLLERIDALSALGRLTELKEMLSFEYSVLPQAFQHMYLAVVRSRLGEKAATANEWQRALDLADSADNLLALADFAQKNGSPDIVDAALERAVIKQPGLRSAYVTRLRLLELTGPTAKAEGVASEMIQLWPDDIATQMHEIYLRLLLDSSPSEAATAEQEAETLAEKLPLGGVARSTIALARLRQNRPAAAMEALSDSPDHAPAENISWPVYVAALAANGWKDKARAEAGKIATATILPEERALIAPLLKQ